MPLRRWRGWRIMMVLLRSAARLPWWLCDCVVSVMSECGEWDQCRVRHNAFRSVFHMRLEEAGGTQGNVRCGGGLF